MQLNIKRWGNSLALRIPSDLAKAMNLQEDTPIELVLENGKLILSRKGGVGIILRKRNLRGTVGEGKAARMLDKGRSSQDILRLMREEN
jgi:antitoxin MazE